MKKSLFAGSSGERGAMVPLTSFGGIDLFARLKKIVTLFGRAEAVPPAKAKVSANLASDEEAKKKRRNWAKEIKACKIQFDDTTISGMLLNLSDDGADIRLPLHQAKPPKYFILKFPPGHRYDCVIRWRNGDKVGVSFL